MGSQTPTICLLTITDGRGLCLCKTLEALVKHIDYQFQYSLLINDSGDKSYATWLNVRYPTFQKIHHEVRRGFAGAVISAWENLPECDYVLTVEDDMVLQRDVNILDLVTILEGNPSLAQIVLLRNAWNSDEQAAGGIVQLHPADYIERETKGIAWLEHHRHYSTNVNLQPYRITRLGWPNVEHSEGHFGAKLRDQGYSFGYYGKKTDPPLVEHIGVQRVGVYY